MIKSLTGFGSVEVSTKSNQLTVVIRSINARFLDIKFRGIDLDPQFELEIRKEVEKKLVRGNVHVQLYFNNQVRTGNPIKFDKERFELIEEIVGKVQTDYGKHLNMSELISINDLLISSETEDLDHSSILKGVKEALSSLDAMRRNEGAIIDKDLTKRINTIQKTLNELNQKSKNFVEQLSREYKDKILSLLNDVTVDDDRLAQEIVIQVDKFDYTEEIVRGLGHCEQFSKYMKNNEPVGKKLNFLLQELSREINTIGSKSPTGEISNKVVEIKSEVEKIREQVQNIL